MASYYLTDGSKMSKTAIDNKIAVSKKAKWDIQIEEHGYNFCEHCKRNDISFSSTSHIIGVKECQELRQSEIAWDVLNLEILCNPDHLKVEDKPLQERIEIYNSRL
jgi:hypothetical protein